MTLGELLEFLTREAKEYREDCVSSINRNKHMNNCKGECSIEQNDVDAVLVGFINKIAAKGGVDYALYAKDLVKITASDFF